MYNKTTKMDKQIIHQDTSTAIRNTHTHEKKINKKLHHLTRMPSSLLWRCPSFVGLHFAQSSPPPPPRLPLCPTRHHTSIPPTCIYILHSASLSYPFPHSFSHFPLHPIMPSLPPSLPSLPIHPPHFLRRRLFPFSSPAPLSTFPSSVSSSLPTTPPPPPSLSPPPLPPLLLTTNSDLSRGGLPRVHFSPAFS